MKKNTFLNLVVISIAVLAIISLSAFNINIESEKRLLSSEDTFEIPEDIQNIFDKSCFGCHNVDAKSDKAKKKLMIDQMHELSKAKLIAALGDIKDVVEEGDMPPKKFLDKYPDKAMTEEETKMIKEWADKATDALLN